MFNAVVFTIVVLVIYCIRRKYSYWERKGVPGPKAWPFFGNIFQSFTQKKTVGQIFREIYRKYDNSPVVGAYRTSDPVLIIRDPEFINKILVQDAKYFFNNDFSVDKNLDPLQGASPFVQKDAEWKTTRTSLSPGFTSGKIKNLHSLIEEVNDRLLNYLNSQPNIKTGQTLETQNLCRRYTLDNVALTAFGIHGRCFESDESDFMKLANSFIAPGSFALSMLQLFPLISSFISLKVVPEQVEKELTKIVSDVLQFRKAKGIVSKDYLQFIGDLGETKNMTYTEITAHASTFFEDGYETSALVMSYVLFNLAQNPECQSKLRAEIQKQANSNPDSKIFFEDLTNMPYLTACIYESMRLCPVLELYTRVCNDPYVYTTTNESPKHLQKMSVNIDSGTVCIIPFGGICHDQHYFSEPESFKPERFLGKDRLNAFKKVFYPFGGGHRICLGLRFGFMQVQMGVMKVVKNFEVSLNAKTKLPFEFRSWTILNKVKDGVWLSYKKLS